ncbi:MAG: thioredoxin domain-containing protein [Janthinobacterium lividum]
MPITRRRLLVASAAVPLLARAAVAAPAADPRMADRSLGPADAKVVVQEWFSLTCTHCAAFSRTVFPDVQKQLIDTGKIRYVFKDFPLDQVALSAAMVARSLPDERYVPFVEALLASQDRWAFSRTSNSTDELAKMAALAGMGRAAFDATLADEALKTAILMEQDAGTKKYTINATPTFVFGDTPHSGELSFDSFAKLAGA